MNTQQRKRGIGLRITVQLFILLLLVGSIGMGCSSVSKTTRTEKETTVTHPADQTATTFHPTEKTVVEKETTTETEAQSAGGGGVLSTTVDVVGEILALPFRIVAGLLRAIF